MTPADGRASPVGRRALGAAARAATHVRRRAGATPRILAALALAALAGPSAVARADCTVAQIIANEPGCQNPSGNCSITQPHTVENGCTLDFGARDVRWDSVLSVGSRMATLRAQSLALLVHARIDAVGGGATQSGGMIVIETTGNFTAARSGNQNALIDASGNRTGGQIIIRAGGSATVDGKLLARGLNGPAAGGLIAVTATGAMSAGDKSVISVQGGTDSEGSGEIDLSAGGDLTLASDPDVSGFDGGYLQLEAGGKLTMKGANASGRGDAGSGGCVDGTAGGGLEIKGDVDATGVGGTFMTGGCGGLVCLDAGLGDMTIDSAAVIDADGASPDGGGGLITLMGRGSAMISGDVTARGPSGETCGGDLCATFGFDLNLFSGSSLDVSGGDSGGEADLFAARNMTISGPIDASGRQSGSLGGDVTLHAAEQVRGSLTLGSTVDVRSNAPCTQENGCGLGGTTDLASCSLTINNAGALLAGGPDAGENDLTAREQMTVRGVVDAVATVGGGAPGVNRFAYRIGHVPTVIGSGPKPGAQMVATTTCPEVGNTDPPCLNPCPTCGDGAVDYPETCDLGVMPPQSCSGCSIYCQLEDCDDHQMCTGDSCNPTFGCVNQPTPDCQEPTATATSTRPTPTITPTPAATASQTPTASLAATGTSSPTRSITPTATSTGTAPATATTAPASATATASDTATAPSTATATPATTAAATATGTDTPEMAPTDTRPPSCTGDCDRGGTVSVNELVLGVNIALGNNTVSACPPFDTDGDGGVSISELIAAVNAALGGC